MCTAKSCSHAQSAKSPSLHRAVLALALIAVGAGVSLHLRASHFAHWWIPGVVLLILVHGAIVGAIVWIAGRLRPGHHASSAGHDAGGEAHEHSHGKVLHTPRSYDWLVRMLTLGGERKFRHGILDVATLRAGETVLDVGSGTGTLLIEAAQRVAPGGEVHGVEPSPEMLAHARRKAAAKGVTANFVEGSANGLPFPDASFDAVFCTMVLHHLPAAVQAAALGEMRRVARPGGRIILVDMQKSQTMSGALSLITLFHNIGTQATAPDWGNIETALRQGGIDVIEKHSMWSGSVTALVAQVGSRQEVADSGLAIAR